MAVFPDRGDPLRTGVLYLPITHSSPGPEEIGIELPVDVRYAAGLDNQKQCILVSQGNLDTWPEDVSNLPGRPGVFEYGILPPGIFKAIQAMFARCYAEKKFNIVARNQPSA